MKKNSNGRVHVNVLGKGNRLDFLGNQGEVLEAHFREQCDDGLSFQFEMVGTGDMKLGGWNWKAEISYNLEDVKDEEGYQACAHSAFRRSRIQQFQRIPPPGCWEEDDEAV